MGCTQAGKQDLVLGTGDNKSRRDSERDSRREGRRRRRIMIGIIYKLCSFWSNIIEKVILIKD